MAPVRLHRFALSGHSHRVQLFLSLLGRPVELVDVDLVDGAHKRAPFLALNPFGQVPVIEDGDVVLADSNAILVYLAQRYDPDRRWYPPALAAEIQRWLSVAAGELVRGPADARRASVFGARVDVPEARATAAALFGLLERHLGARAFLAGSAPTIADLALYTYTAHAPEGGVGLADYPAVCGWLGRIEALPGFVPMAKTPVEA